MSGWREVTTVQFVERRWNLMRQYTLDNLEVDKATSKDSSQAAVKRKITKNQREFEFEVSILGIVQHKKYRVSRAWDGSTDLETINTQQVHSSTSENAMNLSSDVHGLPKASVSDAEIKPNDLPYHNGVEHVHASYLKPAAICEIWFALSGILDQFLEWSPINREIYLDRLAIRYDRDGEPSQLALIDVFVSTENPLKEPPLITANTVLSILSVDYPTDKVFCYVSDDGSAMLTFEALSETVSWKLQEAIAPKFEEECCFWKAC
ncbi:hypothetical protein KIW84_021055 [Lathyrus oleraceus]|uniref:Uncharacterized protein n=1 Tax=Pisum sativum TaxID=3888 RepID=A0A9D5B8S1_PEA|nr:hypothetical protein KIW84_021055 [Pisum sativum]